MYNIFGLYRNKRMPETQRSAVILNAMGQANANEYKTKLTRASV